MSRQTKNVNEAWLSNPRTMYVVICCAVVAVGTLRLDPGQHLAGATLPKTKYEATGTPLDASVPAQDDNTTNGRVRTVTRNRTSQGLLIESRQDVASKRSRGRYEQPGSVVLPTISIRPLTPNMIPAQPTDHVGSQKADPCSQDSNSTPPVPQATDGTPPAGKTATCVPASPEQPGTSNTELRIRLPRSNPQFPPPQPRAAHNVIPPRHQKGSIQIAQHQEKRTRDLSVLSEHHRPEVRNHSPEAPTKAYPYVATQDFNQSQTKSIRQPHQDANRMPVELPVPHGHSLSHSQGPGPRSGRVIQHRSRPLQSGHSMSLRPGTSRFRGRIGSDHNSTSAQRVSGARAGHAVQQQSGVHPTPALRKGQISPSVTRPIPATPTRWSRPRENGP